MSKCEFELERENPVYISGENVKGRIILTTKKVKLINAIFVELKGEAKVRWTKGEKDTARSYSSQQLLLSESIQVFKGKDFPAGRHVYKITLPISPECPSSCEGPYGHISYKILVRFDRHWSSDKFFNMPIIVHKPLDLNNNPEYLLPVKDENIKFFCRWPCKSGPILSSLVIPCGAYIPEEHIPFQVEVDNQSSDYDISGIEATLYQRFFYLAPKILPTSSICSRNPLVESVINKPTLRLSKRVYESTIIVPPNTIRSTLEDPYIVSVQYELQVKLKTGRLHSDFDISVPVVIGTVSILQPKPSIPAKRRGSCSPPWSIAASSSLHTVDSRRQVIDERQQININMPQFPGYTTFACRAQAEHYENPTDLDYVQEQNSKENLLAETVVNSAIEIINSVK